MAKTLWSRETFDARRSPCAASEPSTRRCADGPVRPAPENRETALELNSADAELVRTQRGYVNADNVSPAQS
jgi:hypothetical protein